MTNYPPPVPKPTPAGTPRVALARTKATYMNLRAGPGTHYEDIGDIRNHSVVTYYPATKRADGWIWIEQYGNAGWGSTSVVTFDDLPVSPPNQPWIATPYDNKVAIWHWRGDSIAENSIEEVCQNIKKYAPHVTSVFVKTSDYTPSTGAQWMGYWDSKRSLAIDGPASIDRWVSTLQKYGLEFHAWCVPRGADLVRETDLIIQACLRPGVKSMILDVEPYDGFWLGGKEGIRPFMLRIRRAIPGTFHLGMTVDPRPRHYEGIYPLEWYPFINSIHPQDYWTTFRRTPEEVLEETFRVWGGYGRPIIPALQGDSNVNEMREAHTLATKKHGAPGVSWWRLGVIGPAQFGAINQPIEISTPPTVPPTAPPEEQYTDEVVVRPGDPGFSVWVHTDKQELSTFQGTWGWTVYYKPTEAQTSKVAIRWYNPISESGQYEIATFVPARHATTRNARFKIHGVKGASSELIVPINQEANRNTWVKLGVFEIDKDAINAGTIFLNDLTGETGREIAFDAIRWRRVVAPGGPSDGHLADGFDPPIGTLEERRSDDVWPGKWYDASPFGKLYFIGTPSEAYHTGADLNLPRDADAHAPVYAAASGVVTFAARLPVWGNVIIIRHDPLEPGGLVLYGRYAHVEDMVVQVGQRVTRGQQIAKVGNAFGVYAYHLHFDLSPTTILETTPNHWPGKNYDAMFSNYIDPREWIMNNRPKHR
nr:MAG: hypothetical protein DIU68_10390 [Chloroflexota bacterium]